MRIRIVRATVLSAGLACGACGGAGAGGAAPVVTTAVAPTAVTRGPTLAPRPAASPGEGYKQDYGY